MSNFDDLGIVGKLVLPTSQRYKPCTEASLGLQDMILRTEAVGMFLMQRGHFLIEILARSEELLTIRELRVVAEVNLLLKGLSSRTKSLRVRENLRANAASQIGCFVNNTSQNLARCWIVFHGFAYNSLVSRPFLTRKVSNRSSHHVPCNG